LILYGGPDSDFGVRQDEQFSLLFRMFLTEL